MAIADGGAVGLHIADGAEILDPAFLAQGDVAFLGLAQRLGEGELQVVGEALVWEHHEGVIVDRFFDHLNGVGRLRAGGVEAGDRHAKIGVQRVYSISCRDIRSSRHFPDVF